MDNTRIIRQTLGIIAQGYYMLQGETVSDERIKISLRLSREQIRSATVITDQQVSNLIDELPKYRASIIDAASSLVNAPAAISRS